MAKTNRKPVEEHSEEINPVVKRLECFNLRLKAINSQSQIQALNEALKRASVELNAIPGRIEEVKKQAQSLEQQYMASYEELKKILDCPEGCEINLETGAIFDPNRPQQPAAN